jgi:phosphoribosylaminoimidazolecarboxamide formyltransferase/IMP cyclohydrolase
VTDVGKAALVSVHDKDGLEDFARGLKDLGFSIISSGGTARYLADRGIPSVPVEEITRSPEMLGGRVKTLHPHIYGGILFRRPLQEDRDKVNELGMAPIDLVAVNLYPFERTVRSTDSTFADCIEQIDIGGPSLIRAAAKNHESVTVVVDPSDYGLVLERLRSPQGIGPQDRLALAIKAFRTTSAYDAAIGDYLTKEHSPDLPWGGSLRMRFERAFDLRYGENPHQKGAYFRDPSFSGVSVANSRVLWGKELSYNNIYDVDAVLDILMDFPGDPCCGIIKHNNPSGVAVGRQGSENPLKDAYIRAMECDPLSSYGGIVGLNRGCDPDTARAISEKFYEVIIAPDFDPEALEILKAKKNLRLISVDRPIAEAGTPEHKWVKVRGGLLIQTMNWPSFEPGGWRTVTENAPTPEQVRDLVFAAKVVKHVKSNCVVLARDAVTTGIGSGQMSRVDSCFMAVHKAGPKARGSVLASDAFFPFRDGIDTLGEAGVTAISQPGGSIHDEEVIRAANEHGIAMVFTSVRLFKH